MYVGNPTKSYNIHESTNGTITVDSDSYYSKLEALDHWIEKLIEALKGISGALPIYENNANFNVVPNKVQKIEDTIIKCRDYLTGIIKEGIIAPYRGICTMKTHFDKIGKRCIDCEENATANYCHDKCEICMKQKEIYEKAQERVVKNLYAQKIKTALVKNMTPITTPEPTRENTDPKMFNRLGNFVDKFLEVTYTLKDTDIS
ncbi:MAG: hypothetical protein ACXVHW_09945, partial [Methanobacterium sp.]